MAAHEVLIDVPKTAPWMTEVWVRFARRPIGLAPLMYWQEVVGLEEGDLERYEQHRRLVGSVTTDSLREAARRLWEDVLLLYG